MKIPFNELYNMPIRDRKYYIMRHNQTVEEENAEYQRRNNGNSNTTNVIEGYTKKEQENIRNTQKRANS